MANQKTKPNIPELLSPAGSMAALRAAIDAGADAVYFAMPEFNARIGADNFTPDSFATGVELCHLFGVRSYITLNTQVYDREREDFLRTAEKAYLAGVDAAIVGDLGAASLLRKYIPELELHASTQLSGHCADAGRELKRLGFTRTVCAREMSLEDIKSFTAAGIETEIFIHGALCVCHSGQCLFSSLVGGRSGNRGLCAQPCRLPYRTPKGKSDYPLSLKDMSLAAHIPEIIDSGVTSLKIEGRMKPAEYVYGVTAIYRRLLDEGRAATGDELRRLADIFSRGGGFTDSYFVGRARGEAAKGMLGTRSESDKQRSKESAATKTEPRRTAVRLSAEIRKGSPMKLSLELNGGDVARFKGVTDPVVTVYGDTPDEALNRPAEKDAVTAALSKFGGTPFFCESTDVTLDEGLLIPHSSLNALRREAVELLKQKINEPYLKRSGFALPHISFERPTKNAVEGGRIAVFYDHTAVTDTAKSYFDRIYLPLTAFDGMSREALSGCDKWGVLLPPVIFDSESKPAEKLLLKARELGVCHALVDNLGHLALARRCGMIAHGGMRLGIANTDAARLVGDLGLEDMILSPELTAPRLRDIAGAVKGCGAIVYGKLPLMITEKCLIREISSCEECRKNRGSAILTDRTGARFYVKREFGHRSLIFNSLPTYAADKMPRVENAMFIFTDENATAVDAVISDYRHGAAPSGKVRRI